RRRQPPDRRHGVRSPVRRLPARRGGDRALRRQRSLAVEARGPLHRRHRRPAAVGAARQPAVLGPLPRRDDGDLLMTARALLGRLLAATALATVLAGPAHGDPPTFKVIVNPGNPITAVEADFLRNAYLKKAGGWGGGAAIHPVDLSTRFAARTRFTQD